MTKAITCIAHGSPKRAANLFMKKLVKKLCGGRRVNLGFLGFDGPDVPTALISHVSHGYKHIHIIPLFLTPGKHVTTDIPKLIKKFKQEHQKITITVDNFIGSDNHFIDFLKQKI